MKIMLKQTVLVITTLFLVATNADAQGFTNLYSFTPDAALGPEIYTNSDGASPVGLILSGETLYGVTGQGGNGSGTIFKINTDGTGFTNLYSFTLSSGFPAFTNGDGAFPNSDLVLSGNVLYGATYRGGNYGNGTIFKINTNGTAFSVLYAFTANSGFPTFTNSDGARPFGGVILSGNTLYGTATSGGSGGSGTVFSVNANGMDFTNLYNFSALNSSTNSDGDLPPARLLLVGETLYGTTAEGGNGGDGTVFAIETSGIGFTNLYSFSGNDGADPYGGVVLFSNTLYGTTATGGDSGMGTVFAVNTDGTGFTNLHSFNRSDGDFGISLGSGVIVSSATTLLLSGNALYGTTPYGGGESSGTVFAINTDGTGFNSFYNFTIPGAASPYTNSDGTNPDATLILSGNTLYGTASAGGSGGDGTVFALTLPPPNLNIQLNGHTVILSWSNPAFSLQAAPAVTGTYTNVPDATSPYTNVITGSQQFFRLQAN